LNGARGRRRGAWVWFAAAIGAALAARGSEPVLYLGSGGWGAVAGLPASAAPPDESWGFEAGHWVGRIPADASELAWGDHAFRLADAQPPPLAPALLSVVRNAFGPCLVRSLSVRFDSMVRSRRWSLVFNPEGAEPEIRPLVFADGRKIGIALQLEDVATGSRYVLRPTRQGREGGSKLPWLGGDARFYAGEVDGNRLAWSLVVAPGERDRWLLQGQLRTMEPQTRRLRLRIALRTGSPGLPVLQPEAPPAVAAILDGHAIALYADLGEPRRLRMAGDPQSIGLELDLAVTPATGNFPGMATFSLEAASWSSAGPEAAAEEAAERLARLGGRIGLPDAVRRGESGALPEFDLSRTELAHPGGFRDPADVRQYLMLKMSGLFPDHDWLASAFLSLAQDAAGQPRIELADGRAILAVNPDPDLPAMLEMGQNRGRTILDHIRQSRAPAVLLRAGGSSAAMDCGARALRYCDYPAVWEEGPETVGVDLRHAETELIASLACVLASNNVCLVVADAGPLAPFTTCHADALACASADPAEMRRQRTLAGARPVLWLAKQPDPAAQELARKLGFVRPGDFNDN